MPNFKLYVDLDGVLADFERRVKEVTGKHPHELQLKDMWRKLAGTPDFYNTLDWMPDGEEFWNAVKHLKPTVLTGIPIGNWAPKQKRNWCYRKLGWDVPVITCFARDKVTEANKITPEGSTPLLVDDTKKNATNWEAGGGHFILHIDAKNSLAALANLGLL